MKSGRTKTTGLIRNVIAPAGEEALVNTLKKQHFSITIDEATDRTTTKFLAIIVKYYCKERGKPVDEFFSIPVVTNATAEGLKDLVLEEFRKANIPLKNIIGFASDNCATMAGHIGGVAALLKLVIPSLVVMGCICHSFALCSAAACNKLDPSIVEFSHELYSFVSSSPKRLHEFQEYQVAVDVVKHKILYPSTTRWLVMEDVSVRLLEQWPALIPFFKTHADAGIESAKKIYRGLLSINMQLHYHFLSYVLPLVNKLNVKFQRENVQIHKYLRTIQAGLTSIQDCFIKPDVLKKKNPFDVDHRNPANFRKLDEMYFGAKVENLVNQVLQVSDPVRMISNKDVVNSFRSKGLEFFIELCSQIKQRVKHKDPVVSRLHFIDPLVALSGSEPSIGILFDHFSAALPELNVEDICNEWRSVPKVKDLRDHFQKYQSALPQEKKRKIKLREAEQVPCPRSLRSQRRIKRQEMISRAEISGEWDDGWSDGMSEIK